MDTTEITESTVGEVEPTEQMWREVIAQLRPACAGRIADPERADDVVGDLLVRIQQNLHSIEDRQRLLHWVVRIAPVLQPDEDQAAVLGELSSCLRSLLGGLSPEQRRAVEMIDLDGLPRAEAARREGVSLSGMKSHRAQRGRRRLAAHQCRGRSGGPRAVSVARRPPRAEARGPRWAAGSTAVAGVRCRHRRRSASRRRRCPSR